LIARHTGATITSIPLPAVTGGQWPEEEVWVFEAQPHLRQVTIDDVPPIDPQQTTLPKEWRSFPAYMLKAGGVLKLTEKKRGDPEPAPDQLTLQRQWWLDFDGRGYTVQDAIAGTMTRGWRLDLPALEPWAVLRSMGKSSSLLEAIKTHEQVLNCGAGKCP
jgi:hypothetical protein